MSQYSKLASAQESDTAVLWKLNRADLIAHHAAVKSGDEDGAAKCKQRLWERNLRLIYVVRTKHLSNNRMEYPDDDLASLFYMAISRSLDNYNLQYDKDPMSWPNHAINNLRYEIQVADRDKEPVHISMREHRKTKSKKGENPELKLERVGITEKSIHLVEDHLMDREDLDAEKARRHLYGLMDRATQRVACETKARKIQMLRRTVEGYNYVEVGEAYGIGSGHASKLVGQGLALLQEQARLDEEDAAY